MMYMCNHMHMYMRMHMHMCTGVGQSWSVGHRHGTILHTAKRHGWILRRVFVSHAHTCVSLSRMRYRYRWMLWRVSVMVEAPDIV